MALLRCDTCKKTVVAFGGWDTPVKLACKECYKKQKKNETNTRNI